MHLSHKAAQFAMFCHAAAGQRRKYSGTPYIRHPEAVARIVRTVAHTETMIAPAWLHDVVEDTGTTLAAIESHFGRSVAALVAMLTDVSRPTDGNRRARKAMDRAHTARASAEAQTVKLADLIDNTDSIVGHDPTFARVYLAEKLQLLSVLTRGDGTLWRRAYDQTVDAMAGLQAVA